MVHHSSTPSLLTFVSCFLWLPAYATPTGVEGADSALRSRGSLAFCPTLNVTSEKGIDPECKASPHTLALNKAAYGYDNTDITVTAWTLGEDINCDRTWLKTTDGCWVSEWDVTTTNGSYTTTLCYEDHDRLKIVKIPAVTKYKTECISMPGQYATDVDQRIKMYLEDVDLDLICKHASETGYLYYKTTSDCFVDNIMLDGPEDPEDLPDCGPLPFAKSGDMRRPDANDTDAQTCESAKKKNLRKPKNNPVAPAPGTTGTATLTLRSTQVARTARYLQNTTVGEDYAPCLTDADPDSDIEDVYQFGETITIQCAHDWTKTLPEGGITEQWYLMTTDFCYVNQSLVDYQVIGENYMYPLCEDFVDTESKRVSDQGIPHFT